MAKLMCEDCGIRAQGTGPGDKAARGSHLCNPCYDYAGWENEHNDYGHDEGTPDDKCPLCHPELDPRKPKRTGHTNTVAKTRTSHDGHPHPATPRDRAKCRAFMATTGQPYDCRV